LRLLDPKAAPDGLGSLLDPKAAPDGLGSLLDPKAAPDGLGSLLDPNHAGSLHPNLKPTIMRSMFHMTGSNDSVSVAEMARQ
jgi:hypothetical protein